MLPPEREEQTRFSSSSDTGRDLTLSESAMLQFKCGGLIPIRLGRREPAIRIPIDRDQTDRIPTGRTDQLRSAEPIS